MLYLPLGAPCPSCPVCFSIPPEEGGLTPLAGPFSQVSFCWSLFCEPLQNLTPQASCCLWFLHLFELQFPYLWNGDTNSPLLARDLKSFQGSHSTQKGYLSTKLQILPSGSQVDPLFPQCAILKVAGMVNILCFLPQHSCGSMQPGSPDIVCNSTATALHPTSLLHDKLGTGGFHSFLTST